MGGQSKVARHASAGDASGRIPGTYLTYEEKTMINLTDEDTGQPIGSITEAQLQYLIDQLEEEWPEDRDYAITPMLVDYFEGQGADSELVALFRKALRGREAVNILWSNE
jgi:processive 1,2-diacylglycerol beta-glucosyltransferase